jgi:hypothetical protein
MRVGEHDTGHRPDHLRHRVPADLGQREPVPGATPQVPVGHGDDRVRCAPDTGPNSRINAVRPRKVAVLFSSSCRPTSFGGQLSGGYARSDHERDQQGAAQELGQQSPT